MDLADVANFHPDTVPWTEDSTFNAWRDAILKAIPFGDNRDIALKLLSALDPAAGREDVIKAQFWTDALSAPPRGEEREEQLATFLADLACLGRPAPPIGPPVDAAPYVARGLIENGRLRSTGSQVAAVADRLRKGKSDPSACPGVRGFTDNDWAELHQLVVDANRAADKKAM
jgi:hypothetical protein